MTTDTKQTLLDAALGYTRMGWQVFPCHPTGHQPLDGSKDKHGRGGFYLATTDEKQIRTWWARWPEAAIGLRTGELSGVFAVDIDPRNGGSFSIEHIEAEHGELPETVESQTGGGGRHLFFRWPGNRDFPRHPELPITPWRQRVTEKPQAIT